MNNNNNNYIAIIGLGYVGLSLAVAFSKHYHVLGYDINAKRIQTLCNGVDYNNLFNIDELAATKDNLVFTNRIADIKQANFYTVSVATPAYFYETPNLKPLIAATESLATIIKKNDIIVFESTVYPGTTEAICVPILEKSSRLKVGKDFFIGYSPERISPGDKEHSLTTITKIISAQDQKTLKKIQDIYATICNVVYPVLNIRTAEAIKLLENTQRDVNIALMNEFAKIMHALNINMYNVIDGAKTKLGFIPFKPGFVGGHCISIDPHYLAFEAKRHGVQPDLILTARRINDDMTHFIIQSLLKLLITYQIDTKNLNIGLLGITYKENVLDLRNSLALKLYKELLSYTFTCQLHDPIATNINAPDIQLTNIGKLKNLSVIIIAVGHDFYRDLGLAQIIKTGNTNVILMDIPNLFVEQAAELKNLIYWNL